jgi:hypothetical protein
MLAILYLAATVWFGDCVCRCFYRSATLRQRFAQGFLVGLLLSSIITYLGALCFYWTRQPLIWGNLIFLAAFGLAAWALPCRRASEYLAATPARPAGDDRWDWAFLFVYFVFGWWLFSNNLTFQDGNFLFGFKSWSDFGANLSVAQSLVLGHNFPTEHPFFPGLLIRYHFLFWFQAGNLSFLGLNLALSVNLLSILSLMALLTLIMALAEILFDSRAVARISAGLFFFASSSLAYVPFLRSQPTWEAAWNAILTLPSFLPTGYNFRGEGWGALSVDVFINQRHLISGAGILLVVAVFLADFYKHKRAAEAVEETEPPPVENLLFGNVLDNAADPNPHAPPATNGVPDFALPQIFNPPAPKITPAQRLASLIKHGPDVRENLAALLFTGFLIGALPFWNSAIFVAALIVLGGVWLLLPYRLYLSCVLGTAAVVGLPQAIMLKSGDMAPSGQPLLHFGYTIPEPTVPLVLEYVAWTFGFKWLLLLIALLLLPRIHLRFVAAFTLLLPVVFLFQLSTDAFNNHKLLNVWNIFASTYAAYALWRIGRGRFPRRILAAALALAMIAGAVIDIFPVRNDPLLTVPFAKDRLTLWLLENTQPSDVFLTQWHLSHPILFTGRKIFLGNTLFAWTAGYKVGEREDVFKQMFTERNPNALLKLLHKHNISYVAIDDGVRQHHLIKPTGINEQTYQQYFPQVFNDPSPVYANVTIYRVPTP